MAKEKITTNWLGFVLVAGKKFDVYLPTRYACWFRINPFPAGFKIPYVNKGVLRAIGLNNRVRKNSPMKHTITIQQATV